MTHRVSRSLVRFFALLLLAGCVGTIIAPATTVAGPGDGTILGATKIIDHGPDSMRYNYVVVAEGFTAAEQAQFDAVATQLVNSLFAFSPFDSMGAAINVYRLNVESNESGADMNAGCGLPVVSVATYFDASFCNSGIPRALIVNNSVVIGALNTHVPTWDQAVVVVNSTRWGGTGGSVATTSIASGWEGIVIHELGHSAFGLADEYNYWAGCGADTDRDNHPNYEPSEPNVTIQTNRALIKWNSLIEPATPIPTTVNPNCAQCDNQPNPQPQFTVGLYEGAHYYHCDAYRPQYRCMMRDLANYFCAVCQAEVTYTLAQYMGPAFTAAPRVGHESLTVDFTYSSPLEATAWTWYFGDGDSALVENPSHTYGPGSFDVTLRVNTVNGVQTLAQEGYVTVWADTLTVPETEGNIGAAGYMEIDLTNIVPIHELVLPITMTNVSSKFFFDSISFVGTRLEPAESKQVIYDDSFAGNLAMRIRTDAGGGTPPLAPGDGPIARLHYRVRMGAAPGDTSWVTTAPLGSYTFKARSYENEYEPIAYGATLRATVSCSCPFQADFNADGFLDATDLSLVIDGVFFGWPIPHDPDCPVDRGDFNNDSFSDSVDLSEMIDHVYFGGAGPVDPCNP